MDNSAFLLLLGERGKQINRLCCLSHKCSLGRIGMQCDVTMADKQNGPLLVTQVVRKRFLASHSALNVELWGSKLDEIGHIIFIGKGQKSEKWQREWTKDGEKAYLCFICTISSLFSPRIFNWRFKSRTERVTNSSSVIPHWNRRNSRYSYNALKQKKQ